MQYIVLHDSRDDEGLCELCNSQMEIVYFNATEKFETFCYKCPDCGSKTWLLLEKIQCPSTFANLRENA